MASVGCSFLWPEEVKLIHSSRPLRHIKKPSLQSLPRQSVQSSLWPFTHQGHSQALPPNHHPSFKLKCTTRACTQKGSYVLSGWHHCLLHRSHWQVTPLRAGALAREHSSGVVEGVPKSRSIRYCLAPLNHLLQSRHQNEQSPRTSYILEWSFHS